MCWGGLRTTSYNNHYVYDAKHDELGMRMVRTLCSAGQTSVSFVSGQFHIQISSHKIIQRNYCIFALRIPAIKVNWIWKRQKTVINPHNGFNLVLNFTLVCQDNPDTSEAVHKYLHMIPSLAALHQIQLDLMSQAILAWCRDFALRVKNKSSLCLPATVINHLPCRWKTALAMPSSFLQMQLYSP